MPLKSSPQPTLFNPPANRKLQQPFIPSDHLGPDRPKGRNDFEHFGSIRYPFWRKDGTGITRQQIAITRKGRVHRRVGGTALIDMQLVQQCERVIDALEKILVVLDHLATHAFHASH